MEYSFSPKDIISGSDSPLEKAEKGISRNDKIPSDGEESLRKEERPLNKLLDDDNIRIMEYFIPYCDTSISRILALMIKTRELNKIMRGFDEPQLKACANDNGSRDLESLLRSLKHNVSPEMAAQIDSVLQVLQFNRMYQRFNEITRDHPEILNMMANGRTGSGRDDAGPFSDPSVFTLLNTMLNGNDAGAGDKMKNVLELAMKGSSENIDVTNLLATLMSRQG